MRESMARLTPRYCASRTVREYTEKHYLPAASAYRKRAADKGAVGLRVVKWQHALDEKWATLHFGEVKVETRGEQHVYEVQVGLHDLDPKAVRVESYAAGVLLAAGSITTDASLATVRIIPTDEELMVARSAWRAERTALKERHEWAIAQAGLDGRRQDDTPAPRGALDRVKQAWPRDSPSLGDTAPRRQNLLAD